MAMASTSKRYCSVPQCNSYANKNTSLHYFPMKNPKLCKKWKEVLKIGKCISKYMNVCNKHFLCNDFIPSGRVCPALNTSSPSLRGLERLPQYAKILVKSTLAIF